MTSHPREKLSTEVSAEILSAIRHFNEHKGCQIQSLIDEALTDLIGKHHPHRPRPNVMAAYQASHDTFGPLYKKLAE